MPRNIIRFLLVTSFLFFSEVHAAQKAADLGEVFGNIFLIEEHIRELVRVVCYVAASGLLLGAYVRYDKHRKSPVEAPLSSVAVMVFVAIVLILLAMIPIIVPN